MGPASYDRSISAHLGPFEPQAMHESPLSQRVGRFEFRHMGWTGGEKRQDATRRWRGPRRFMPMEYT